ncbi:MAG: hypothetical protein K1X75_12995 [Leptospirales bacterium]|nr:hypothetical protein [Leptospirales bacterium]
MRHIQRISLFLALLAASVTAGCASARMVSVQPGAGGTIGIGGGFLQRDDARANANAMMATNCGNKSPRIVSEGEVVVGQTSSGSSQTSGQSTTNAAGVRVGNVGVGQRRTDSQSQTVSNLTTRDITEWRIDYVCE